MKLSDRDRKILIIGAAAVGLFLLLKFALGPLYTYSQELTEEIENLQFQYEKSLRAITYLAEDINKAIPQKLSLIGQR